jgi:hypothetical protein
MMSLYIATGQSGFRLTGSTTWLRQTPGHISECGQPACQNVPLYTAQLLHTPGGLADDSAARKAV